MPPRSLALREPWPPRSLALPAPRGGSRSGPAEPDPRTPWDGKVSCVAGAALRRGIDASRRQVLEAVAGAACALPLLGWARPLDDPDVVVTVVVPFATGGATDQLARLLVTELNARLRSRFIVENRPGASATIGTRSVAAARPDGKTLLYTTATPLSINPCIFQTLPYDPDADFEPITLTVRQPLVVVTGKQHGIRTLHELVDHLHRHQKTSSYGSYGTGTASHIASALFARKVGAAEVAHVPYNGPVATSDLAEARLTFMIDSWSAVSALVAAGKLQVLASCDTETLPWLPGVATLGGFLKQEFDVSTWNGFFAPRGTPAEILDLLKHEIAATMAREAVHQVIAAKGLIPYPPMSRAEVGAFVAADRRRWQRLVAAAGIERR